MGRVEVFEHLVHGDRGHGPVGVLLCGTQPGRQGGFILRGVDRRPQAVLDGRGLGVVREEAAFSVAVGGGHRRAPRCIEEAERGRGAGRWSEPTTWGCAMPRAQTQERLRESPLDGLSGVGQGAHGQIPQREDPGAWQRLRLHCVPSPLGVWRGGRDRARLKEVACPLVGVPLTRKVSTLCQDGWSVGVMSSSQAAVALRKPQAFQPARKCSVAGLEVASM